MIKRRPTTDPLDERFAAYIDRPADPNACWLWQGALERGYGAGLRINGTQVSAHRISWLLAFGPIPDGLWVLHNCPGGDNPTCVNPRHLWLGTGADNVADRVAKGRNGAAKGEHNGKAKLRAEDIVEIRRRLVEGEEQLSIARQFGIGQTAVSNVLHQRTWRHVG